MFIIHTDGCVRGNPGPMGCGIVVEETPEQDTVMTKKTIATLSVALGTGTNNEAEYAAIELALMHCFYVAKEEPVSLFSDSKVAIDQINNDKKVSSEHLIAAKQRVDKLKKEYVHGISFSWIGRDKNGKADALASAACGMPQAVIMSRGNIFDVIDWPDTPEARDWARKYASQKVSGINNMTEIQKREPKYSDFMPFIYSARPKTAKEEGELFLKKDPPNKGWILKALKGAGPEYVARALYFANMGFLPPYALKCASVAEEQAAVTKKLY